MQYIKTLPIPFVNSLPSSLFRTTVNGAKSLDMKHVLIGPNNGYVDNFEGDEDEPKTNSMIGDIISNIGAVIAVNVTEMIRLDRYINYRIRISVCRILKE